MAEDHHHAQFSFPVSPHLPSVGDHAVAEHPGKFLWRELVALVEEQDLPEEADYVDEDVVVNGGEVLEEASRPGLDVLLIDLERGEEVDGNDRLRKGREERYECFTRAVDVEATEIGCNERSE